MHLKGPFMKLEIISLFLIFFAIITIILGIIKIHTYPGKIAKARNHPQTEAIEVTSLLGLIIFPLWMAALVWAYSGAVVGNLYREQDPDGTDSRPEKTPPDSDDRIKTQPESAQTGVES